MTRINSAIPPKCLTDEHLLAEHREIKRLPSCLRRAMVSGSLRRAPEHFTLGKGHVLFFLDKMNFTMGRYILLRDECKRRGFSVADYLGNWFNNTTPPSCLKDYTPTEEERQLLIARITDRIKQSTKASWHYYGQAITREQAIRLLT